MRPWSKARDAVAVRVNRGVILKVAVASELSLVAMVCSQFDRRGNRTVDLYGLECVHENLLPHKYSFHGDFGGLRAEGCGMAFKGQRLFVTAFSSKTVHVLDVLRMEHVHCILCPSEPRDVDCAGDLMAVLLRGHPMFVEIRQCGGDGAYPLLRTIEPVLHFIDSLSFSHDASLLALKDYQHGVSIFETATWSRSMPRTCQVLAGTALVACHNEEGWLCITRRGIARMEDECGAPLVSDDGRIDQFAVIPRFGLIFVGSDLPWVEDEDVFLVACPDVVAMNAMSVVRVQWMCAVLRSCV